MQIFWSILASMYGSYARRIKITVSTNKWHSIDIYPSCVTHYKEIRALQHTSKQGFPAKAWPALVLIALFQMIVDILLDIIPKINRWRFLKVSDDVESETISMSYSNFATLKFIDCLELWMDLLSITLIVGLEKN